jgi:hypothetical protein
MPPPPFLWQLAPEDEYIARLLGSPLHMRQTGIPLLLNNSRGIEGGLKNLWGQKVETQLHAAWNFLSFRAVSSQLLVNMMFAYFFLSINY